MVAGVDGGGVGAGVGEELAAVDGDGGQGEGAVGVVGVFSVLELEDPGRAGGVAGWEGGLVWGLELGRESFEEGMSD